MMYIPLRIATVNGPRYNRAVSQVNPSSRCNNTCNSPIDTTNEGSNDC
jgi:hypothetical protein